MRKFEVGDRVRFREDYLQYKAGHIAEVVKLDGDGDPITIRPDDGRDDPWMHETLHEVAELITDSDTINHPAHYAGSNGIECIDAMRATLTPDEFRGYCKGAAFKYIWRERQKGGNESLAKAVWYLNEAQK